MLTARPLRYPDDLRTAFRPEDEAECLASAGLSCASAIEMALVFGLEVTVAADEQDFPVLFFGATPLPGKDAAAVWLLAAPAVSRHRRQILKECPVWLDKIHARHPLLFNYVDARNTLHIRWLKLMGFSFLKLHPHWGREQRPFYEFARLPRV